MPSRYWSLQQRRRQGKTIQTKEHSGLQLRVGQKKYSIRFHAFADKAILPGTIELHAGVQGAKPIRPRGRLLQIAYRQLLAKGFKMEL